LVPPGWLEHPARSLGIPRGINLHITPARWRSPEATTFAAIRCTVSTPLWSWVVAS